MHDPKAPTDLRGSSHSVLLPLVYFSTKRFLKFILQEPLAQNSVAGVTCKTVQCNTFFKSQSKRQERP